MEKLQNKQSLQIQLQEPENEGNQSHFQDLTEATDRLYNPQQIDNIQDQNQIKLEGIENDPKEDKYQFFQQQLQQTDIKLKNQLSTPNKKDNTNNETNILNEISENLQKQNQKDIYDFTKNSVIYSNLNLESIRQKQNEMRQKMQEQMKIQVNHKTIINPGSSHEKIEEQNQQKQQVKSTSIPNIQQKNLEKIVENNKSVFDNSSNFESSNIDMNQNLKTSNVQQSTLKTSQRLRSEKKGQCCDCCTEDVLMRNSNILNNIRIQSGNNRINNINNTFILPDECQNKQQEFQKAFKTHVQFYENMKLHKKSGNFFVPKEYKFDQDLCINWHCILCKDSYSKSDNCTLYVPQHLKDKDINIHNSKDQQFQGLDKNLIQYLDKNGNIDYAKIINIDPVEQNRIFNQVLQYQIENQQQFYCQYCINGTKEVHHLGMNCFQFQRSFLQVQVMNSSCMVLVSEKKRFKLKITDRGDLVHYQVVQGEGKYKKEQVEQQLQVIFKNTQQNPTENQPFMLVKSLYKMFLLDKNQTLLWQIERVKCVKNFQVLPQPDYDFSQGKYLDLSQKLQSHDLVVKKQISQPSQFQLQNQQQSQKQVEIEKQQNNIQTPITSPQNNPSQQLVVKLDNKSNNIIQSQQQQYFQSPQKKPKQQQQQINYYYDLLQEKQETFITQQITKQYFVNGKTYDINFYQISDMSGWIILENPLDNVTYFEIVNETQEDRDDNMRKDFSLFLSDYGSVFMSFQNTVIGHRKGSRQYFVINQKEINLNYTMYEKNFDQQEYEIKVAKGFEKSIGKIYISESQQPLVSNNGKYFLVLNPITGILKLLTPLDKKHQLKRKSIAVKEVDVESGIQSTKTQQQQMIKNNIEFDYREMFADEQKLTKTYKIQWQSHYKKIGYAPYYAKTNELNTLQIIGNKYDERDIPEGQQQEEIVVWEVEYKLPKNIKKFKLSKICLEITDDGNINIFYDSCYIVQLWASNSKDLKNKIQDMISWFIEDIFDPILFVCDVFSDIILVYQYSINKLWFYFFSLVICMLVERIAQARMCYQELKCQKNLTRLLWCFVYLDFMSDKYALSQDAKQRKKLLRKIIECIFESLPSIALNIHSIFYGLYYVSEDDNDVYSVNLMQYMALFFSLISSTKVIFEFKVFLRHEEVEQKLLGPKDYEKCNPAVMASIHNIIQIILYIVSFTFCFGIFTDIFRPYGLLVYIAIIYISSLIITFSYQKSMLTQKFVTALPRYDPNGINIFMQFLGFPILLGLGGFVDWTQDEKVDQLSNKFDQFNLVPLWLTAPVFRVIQSIVFTIGYYFFYDEDKQSLIQDITILFHLTFCVWHCFQNYYHLYQKQKNFSGRWLERCFKVLSGNHEKYLSDDMMMMAM